MEMPALKTGGEKESKQPSRLSVYHTDMPEAEHLAPGDEVEFHGKGHVKSNRASDKYSDGQADIDVHSITHKSTKKDGVDGKPKKKNAAHMPVDELKEVIKAGSKDQEDEAE